MPGISFLFWNVKQQPLRERVARLVVAHSCDVVILAECAMQSAAVSRAINEATGETFRVVPGSGSELRLFTRLPLAGWYPLIRESLDAWLGFRIVVAGLPELLLFAVHLPSKLQTEEPDRLLTAHLLSEDVSRLEQRAGHGRTLVVGDLNGNPFEAPVAWAGALHAVMSRDLIVRMRGERTIRAANYQFFYNPMWGVLGDRTSGPPGTYYRSSSGSVNYFWNTYDQVLLRPEIMDRLTDLRVLDTDGVETLLTPNGLPDATNASDHLPLLFRLEW